MFELNVPFFEKNQAKRLGACWNQQTKKWFVPMGIDPNLFQRWWPKSPGKSSLIKKRTIKQHKQVHLLSELLTKISHVIYDGLPNLEWVIAEISEISSFNRHQFLTFVEYTDDGNKCAHVKGCIWKDKAKLLFKNFKEITGSILTSDIKILILVRVEFHPNYGLSLNVQDLDPSYTLGEMAAKVAKIKFVLQEERIFNNNKQLSPPKNFRNIAVISPEKAAGLGDFNREANILSKHDLCVFSYFHATFQGKEAAKNIILALQNILLKHKIFPFDALVIIRGGGSAADLTWLNDLELARKICLAPLYIMAGIGHQRDYTIIDDIVTRPFDTPSKISAHIFQEVIKETEIVKHCFSNLVMSGKARFLKIEAQLEFFIINLTDKSNILLDYTMKELKLRQQKIYDMIQKDYLHVNQITKRIIKEILCQAPEVILKRGFTLVKSLTGENISFMTIAKAHRTFRVIFHDGELITRIVPNIPTIGDQCEEK